jgi:hypothetical protein
LEQSSVKQLSQSREENPAHIAHFISFGVPFQLLAEDVTLLQKMRGMLPLNSEETANPAPTAERFYIRSTSNTYAVYVGDELTIESAKLQLVLEQFRQDLMVHVADHAPDCVFVHAGVVAWRGHALVLPGRSFAGKTTLVAELVKAGATYYSDEYAVFDASGKVHPYARDLQMRKPGSPEQRSIAVEHLGGKPGTISLPVAQVLFVEYREGAMWSPELLSPGMAVLETVRHTLPVQRTPARVMATLSAMMTGATAWRSQRDDAKTLAPLLLKALAEQIELA